jgi:hypothetical protein
MSEWLYQYWFYAFKTAKSWGRGPKNWTALTLDFEQFKNSTRRSLPSTPSDASRSPGSRPQEVSKPLSLCRWLIHINQELDDEFYENTPSPETPDHNDPRDESSWTAWPEDFQNPSFNTRLRDALEHNDFSTIESKKLPVAIPHIAAAARRSGSELLEETLGFAIMGRNIGLIETTLLKIREANISIAPIHPLHIATSYLDGFRSCCDVLHILLVSARSSELEEMYTNDRGHTVLDNLMLAILKSHSSITPQSLCETLRDVPRFPGEEVDICGRWDADSDCIRQLYASGTTTYPSSWKHKFCHTSVQTICHCIMQIFSHARRQLRNSGSGLYLSQCFACGEPLKFQPLHTLVLTTFHLACSACDGEDLFGMVACLLCLVACGVDPEQTASISVRSLVGGEHSEDQCDHEEMTPSDLSQRLSLTAVELPWSNDVLIGWSVFCSILNSCDAMRKEPEGLDEDEIEEWYYRRAERVNNFIGSNEPSRELSELHRGFHSEYGFQDRPDLATLWAAIQTEILSYRRLDEDSSWISENFNMEDLLSSLKDQNHASVKLIEDGVLNTHCICGWLHPANGLISTLQGVCTEYIANLDVWDRATYSPMRTDW